MIICRRVYNAQIVPDGFYSKRNIIYIIIIIYYLNRRVNVVQYIIYNIHIPIYDTGPHSMYCRDVVVSLARI